MDQNQNPYDAPQAPLRESGHGGPALADRGMRLAAAIIDGVIMLMILLPLMFVGGYFSGIMTGQQPSYGQQAMWGLIAFILFLAIQGYPLNATGQTWGKKMLKMKIVDLDGNKPPFSKLIALRYLPTQAIGLIPFLGSIYGLVNVLFIFGEERRCLHDLIAGTRVVMAD
ncbi:RDD family protein [Arenimonas sp.]|uniref:RDD family protein n=1 Tax=Arenimonas sp. TaxID=1872635 RepID=UPI0039E2E0A4